MNFPPHTQAPSKAMQNSLPIPNNMNRQPSFDLEPSISTSGSSSLPMGGPGTDTAAQRLTSFDHAASTVGRSWETSSPSLSSLAFASAHQRQAESRESLGPEEAEAAVTLQRMTTPDLYGMGDTAAKGIAESAETSSVGASTTGKNGQIAPAKGRLPPSSLGSAAIVITGGGELRRMASIFSTIDDNSLGFSRGNSMEAWTMYGPPQASSSSHSTMKRERERDFPGVDVDGMSDKKKQLSENPTNALRRIQSQQQASVARMDSLEQSLSLIDDIDWRDIISPRESVDNYRFVDESSHDNELANEVIKSEKI